MPPHDAQPIEIPRAQRVEDFRQRSLPVIVWSVCAVLVLGLLARRAVSFEYIGLAQAMSYEISASTNGTVDTLVVDLFDDVQAGDVVAKLDDRQVLAAIDTANAMIGLLQAELDSARATVVSESGQGLRDWSADLRRFWIDEEDRRLAVLSLKVIIESDEIEEELLGLEVSRLRELLAQELIGQSEFDNVRMLHERVRQQIVDNRVLLAQTEQESEVARSRRESYEQRLPAVPEVEPLLGPLREAIAVEAARLREIEIQRQGLFLRSPVDGQVSQILCRNGQSVVPGEPIVMIAERSVQEIVAYLDEREATRIEENTAVRLASRARPGVVAESVVLRVAPAIEPLPQRLWRNPQVADYGRAVVIAASPAMQLTPGELVDVRFSD